jgi:hypothetical protein
MIVRTRMILTDSLSVPIIMGNGPMIITPAPFVLGFVLIIEMAIDRKMITIPVMMSITPISPRETQSDNCARQVKHKKAK